MVQQQSIFMPKPTPAGAALVGGRLGAVTQNPLGINPLGDAQVRLHNGHLEANDGATLPARCACCGDTLELSSFRTLRGGVRFFVCREHLISAIARLAVGTLMALIALYALSAPILDGGGLGGRTQLATFGAMLLGGAAMAWFALPVHAGRSRGGWRTLSGVCRAVTRDLAA